MKFSIAASALLLTSTVSAAPSKQAVQKMTEKRHERMAKRLATRRTKGNFPIGENSTNINEGTMFVSTEDVAYDTNWAGATLNDNQISQVVGTFNNPQVTLPSDSEQGSQYGAAYWVGIDGNSCQQALLQTGVSGVIDNGKVQYSAWYEWYPNYSYTFSGFEVNPGDSITAKVVANSPTSGTATIQNHHTGKSVSHTFKKQGKYGSLCQQNAEWIVEDFETNNNLIGFANFGTVGFTSASYVAGGTSKGLGSASTIDVKQGNKQYTKSSITSNSALNVHYVGP